jgi:hypothetical protein
MDAQVALGVDEQLGVTLWVRGVPARALGVGDPQAGGVATLQRDDEIDAGVGPQVAVELERLVELEQGRREVSFGKPS